VKNASVLPYVWMLVGAFFFAVMSALAHDLGDRCPWTLVALARAGLALLFAAALAIGSGVKLVFWRPRTLWIRSLAGSTSLVCGFFALTHMPISDVLALTNMFPLWVALLSWPLLNQPPGFGDWVAVGIGIVGILLSQAPHLQEGNTVMLVAIFSSFTSAIAMMGLNRLKDIDPRAIVVHFSAVSVLFCVGAIVAVSVATGSVSQKAVALDATDWLRLIGVGLSATIGQILLTKAFAVGHPARVSVVALSQVGFAMLFDMLFWGRTFSPWMLLGSALIVLSTASVLSTRRAVEPASVEV
jgi:drug/metabolite transporter (DMT)-like permease